MRFLFVVLLCSWILGVQATPAPGLTLHLNTQLLRDLNLAIQLDGASDLASSAGAHYDALNAAASEGTLAGTIGAGRSLSGEVAFVYAARVSVGKRQRSTPRLLLSPLSTNPMRFALRDSDGEIWFLLENGHPHAAADKQLLDVRVLSLRASPWLAISLKRPGLEQFLLGGAELKLPLRAPLAATTGLTCPPEPLRWPTLGFNADVALELVPEMFELRCQGCSETSTDGLVAIAPGARLRNVGTADIPWFQMFSGTPAPYGADQHPFLVWNMYRLDTDGSLKQLGASAVKHAFFSTNSDCPCPGAPTLYAEGCTDEYDAFTNDIDSFLAPRSEIIPAPGLWARCGSLHDADCNGVRNQGAGGGDGFQNRMNINEADLAAAPGRRFFAEAWYVTRDDINIYNSMATREVLAVKDTSAWAFVTQGNTQIGSMLERARATSAVRPGRMIREAVTPQGRIKLAVTVTPTGTGNYRYRYELMNFEFALVRTQGTMPNLRMLSHTGIQRVSIPLGTATPIAFTFRDADSLIGNDWTPSLSSGNLNFFDPGNNAQTWGRLYRFEFTSSNGPAVGEVLLSAADAAQSITQSVVVLIPSSSASDLLFWADNEQP